MNDKRIKSLLQDLWTKGNKPGGAQHELRPVTKQDIIDICQAVSEKFMKENALVEFVGPVKVCGDIHGQFRDLLRIFSFVGQPDTKTKYLFLGDYVDRGSQSIETVLYLFLQKIRYPKTVFLLRGNHETPGINRNYGFYDEINERYGDSFIWQVFQDVFNCMPLAALISKRIFCAHGGISPELKHFDQIRRIIRPTLIPEKGLMNDLLWSDPSHEGVKGWSTSTRGSRMFGPDEVNMFCRIFDVDVIIRAHEVQMDGFLFECDNHLITVFSAINYTNQFNNAAGIICIDKDMKLSVKCLKPS